MTYFFLSLFIYSFLSVANSLFSPFISIIKHIDYIHFAAYEDQVVSQEFHGLHIHTKATT
jgi:hypothetical protein